MSRKKIGVLLGFVVVIAALGGTGFYFRDDIKGLIPFLQEGSSNDRVYVEKVSKIMNQYAGVSNRFNGTVESQDTYEVSVDSSRKIDKIEVEVGDLVEEGQVLVSYDTSEIKTQIAQANLEIESINYDIESYQKQIQVLQWESAGELSDEEWLDYVTQIQNIQNSIAQKEFDLESKQLEISKFQTQMGNSTVKSKVGGIVKEINEKGMDSNGNSAPFMTILQEGDYRIKGSIDEQNIWTLSEGQAVVVRSRVDAEKTWNGTISLIDTENPAQGNNNNYYMSSSDSTEMATKYPFYIELDSADGLILGQHVYIEMDQGQEEVKEGLWLYGSYIVQEDGGPYVWTANEKNRLEKRYVELGEYDADMDEYEILSGLELSDYITWPMPGLYEGVTTVTDAMEVDYSSPLYNQETDDMGGEMIYGTEEYVDLDEYLPEDGAEMLYEQDRTEMLYEEGETEMLSEIEETKAPEEETEEPTEDAEVKR